MKENTLSIIKPDGVERNLIGKILNHFEKGGLKIVKLKLLHLTIKEAEGFYAIHKDRPFFEELTKYMSRSPIVISVLEGENAVSRNREIMGATNPKEAKPGTIREKYGIEIGKNTVHGSDSIKNAKIEIDYFFK